MRNPIFFLLAVTACACTPSPELLFAQQGGDLGMEDMTPGRPSFGDMRGRPPSDMQGMPMAPCPPPFGATLSFCYFPGGMGTLNLETALEQVPASSSCELVKNVLNANASAVTCTAQFTAAISSSWGFSATKPIYLAVAYAAKQNVNYATFSVTLPAGSANEIIKVNATAGNQNIVNSYTPPGAMFNPGLNLLLGGTAKKAGLTFAWISLSQ